MRRPWLAFAGFLFGAISVIAAIVTIITAPPGGFKIAVLATAIVCAIGGGVYYFLRETKPNPAKAFNRELRRFMPSSQTVEVRYLRNEVELHEVWSYSQSIWGDENIDWDRVISWWRCYPQGVCAMFGPSGLMGYLSLWPVKKTTFKHLLKSSSYFKQLSPKSIAGKTWDKPREYWYISNLVIKPQFRRTRAVRTLFDGAIKKWLTSGRLATRINICASPYSPEGKALLERFGFTGKATPDGHSVYQNKAQLEDLNSMFMNVSETLTKGAEAGN